jgi:hypothetical protein
MSSSPNDQPIDGERAKPGCSSGGGPPSPPWPVEIDRGVAHAARVVDVVLGGTALFRVDRDAAEHAAAALPGGMADLRALVRSQRAFFGRAVRWLVGDVGVRQFLDVGSGIPDGTGIHAVARQIVHDARVVHVDRDPVVLAHAHELFGRDEAAVAFLPGDLSDVAEILCRAGDTLDVGEPVAVLLNGALQHVPDDHDAHRIVRDIAAALAPGSYVAVSRPPSRPT